MKTIVILGAGFGGLRTAQLLGWQIKKRKLTDRYRIVLIDQNEYHTYTPMLYEAATSSAEPVSSSMLRQVITFPITKILAGLPVEFMCSAISQLDATRHTVHLAGGSPMLFDYAVVALGSQAHYYNIPGLEQYALPLKTFKDAIEIRMRVAAFAKMQRGEVRVIIGGGGSTGVECAGEVKMWLNHLQRELPYRFTHEVYLVEGSPDILPGFDLRVVKKVRSRLERLGVQIAVNERIESLNEHAVTLHNGKAIHYDLFVWTGGIKPNTLAGHAGLIVDQTGRLTVNAELECARADSAPSIDARVYALGDVTTVIHPRTGRPIPSTAPIAIAESDVIAHNILEEIVVAEKTEKTAPRLRHYKPQEYPYILPVGGKYAVAKAGPIIISGFLGWILKGLVEFKYLASIMPLSSAIRLWFKGLKIFIQNEQHSG